MGKRSSAWEASQPVLAMLAVAVAFALTNIFLKRSLDDGVNCMLLVTMRQLTASIFLGPIAYFKERNTRPKLTRKIFMYVFLSALMGASVAQYLFYVGLQHTSATFGCAFLNMTPVFTFLIALLFRLEELNYKSTIGKAKILSIAICLTGVTVLMTYRGMVFPHPPQAAAPVDPHHATIDHGHTVASKWAIGASALLAGCVFWSAWFLVQSKLVKEYPCLYSSNALMFFLGFLQAAALTIATQRGISFRPLAGKLEIITIVYSGVVGSGLGFLAMSWCVAKRGPVFTTAFMPLVQMLVAIVDFSILHEALHLGAVLGSILVICGLYILLWAKNKESKSCVVKPVEEAEVDKEITEQRGPPPV